MARPTEIRAVRYFLEEGIELDRKDDESDEEYQERYLNEGAKAIIQAVDESRQDRTDFLVCRRYGQMVDAYGPYATQNQAEKAVQGGKIPAIDGTQFYVLPMYNPKRADDAWAKTDTPAMSEQGLKIWEIARNGGQAAKTHTRRNRKR